MNLAPLLIVLKYAGTTITGVAGVWGTASETRETTGKLSAWGKWALGLAIAGFAVALSSQIGEQIIAKKEKNEADQIAQANKERAKRTEEQLNHQLTLMGQQLETAQKALSVAQGSASAIQSEKTRFNNMTVEVSYEISQTDPKLKNFAASLEKWCKGNGTLPKGTQKLTDFCIIIDLDNFDSSSLNGFTQVVEFFRALAQSVSGVQLRRRPRSDDSPLNDEMSARGDLWASHKTTNLQAGRLIYYSKNQQLIFKPPRFEAAANGWLSDGRIVGISDLTQASMLLHCVWKMKSVDDHNIPLFSEVHPAWVDVTLGDYPFTVENFAPGTKGKIGEQELHRFGGQTCTFIAAVPDAKNILSRSAYKRSIP